MEGKSKNDEAIQVVVRCRPMNSKEKSENRSNIIDIDTEAHTVSIRNPENPNETPKMFTYDASYHEKTLQRFFYEESCFSVIEGTLEGFNSTIFAYGQTGCGKSFTMQGPSTTDEEMRGVIPNSFFHIFQFVKSSKDIEFLIRCSYLELYNEEIRDLLNSSKNPPKCELHEDPQKGIYVKNLTDVVVESPEDLLKMFDKGLDARTVASTNMNAESSRSHSIFTIVVEMNTKDADTGKEMVRMGKLNLVDLAGSERQKKTGAKDATLKEGIKINLSLSALGNVISALSEGSRHIPYRDSKLTRLLQDSLGGNTKTMMVAAISPADYNFEETTSTLRYANRAKNIKNKPKINEDPKDTMIREFKAEIERLRMLLSEQSRTGQMPSQMADLVMQIAPPAHQQQQQQKQKSPAKQSKTENADELEHEVSLTSAAGAGVKSISPAAAAATSAEKSSFTSGNTQTTAADEEDDYGDENWANESGDLVEQEIRQREQAMQYSPDRDQMSAADAEKHQQLLNAAQLGDRSAQDQLVREGVEHRLHQLEGMLMANDAGDGRERGTQQSNSSAAAVVPALTLEQLKAEAEELESYKMRRQNAKKKKEAQKQRELQRILEEKKSMEDELEELRELAARGQGTAAATAAAAAGTTETEALLTKKISKIKKKYEKKLAAAKEELEDLTDNFYYQRKQLMDAITEQEKDGKLYELICRSILSDKDLKKLVSRCKYDEDSDEWIIPFGKKKTLQELHLNHHSDPQSAASLFPDINHPKATNNSNNSSNGSGSDLELQQQERSGTRGSSNRSKGKGNSSSNGSSTESNAKHSTPSIVPLLTLPGNMVTSAALISPVGGRASNGNVVRMPPVSGRVINSSREAATEDNSGLPAAAEKKKLKSNVGGSSGGGNGKNKIPKIPNRGSGGGASSSPPNVAVAGGGGFSDALNSARSAGAGADSSSAAGAVSALSAEEGAGVSAGPIEDWGFQEAKGGGSGNSNGGNGGIGSMASPELQYSDDEDFESTAEGKAQRKKKRKKRKSDDGNAVAAAPEKERVALPPI